MATPAARRFWPKVEVGAAHECWLWIRGQFSTGYGAMQFEGRAQHSNRIAYMLEKGPIPDGMVVMHTCDVRLCCNPEHLVLGTHKDNMADMAGKRRASRGDSHWTRHSPANLARGSVVKGSKLTEGQIREMRKLREVTGMSYDGLAKLYNIAKCTVARILHRKMWAHVK